MTTDDWPPKSFELCNGPLDGGYVVRTGDVMPQRIWCFRLAYSSGLALWQPSRPLLSQAEWLCYIMDGYRFVFETTQARKP